ncbi:dihydrofolate reductase [Candidatus Saccharibacteria bacterium]|nr:dihydrofolate reductase [Candidatus Saccharibacteria bacterium]
MKSIVVAYDKQRGIGASNDLLWRRDLPADLAHFKQLTMGGSIIMGRNTFESIGRALPGRENIVVSHGPIDATDVIAVTSLVAAYNVAHGNIFIIGGGQIYEQALADADVVYATEVHEIFPHATVFFPKLDDAWQERAREPHAADDRNKYNYDFVTYARTSGIR